MRHIYLTLTGLMIASISFGQIVFESNFDTWTDTNHPTDWFGSKTSIEADSVLQITSGATFGTNLAQLTNVNGTHKRFTSEAISLTEGVPYEVEVWVKGNGQIRTGLYDFDLDGFDFGYSYNSYQLISGDQLTSFVQVITPDTTYSMCELILSTLEGIVLIDRVEVRIGEAQEPVAKSIYEIQFTANLDGSSPEAGTYVITNGVVTGVSSTGYWIQDGTGAWNGIRVFDASNTPSIGDNISVTGTVEEYFNFTRINNVSAVVVNGTAALPAPVELGTGAVNAEQYEGVLVRTTGACTVELNNFNEWLINDGTGEIMVNDEMFMYTPVLGTSYMVTGPLNYAFSAFKIEPRDAADVSLANSLNEQAGIVANIYPNPTSDSMTIEHAENENVLVQLFDVNGRQVMSFTMINNKEVVDLTHLSNGFYTLLMTNGVTTGASAIEVKH